MKCLLSECWIIITRYFSINIYGWGQLALAVAIVIYLHTSKRVTDTFADFPEETDTGLTGK